MQFWIDLCNANSKPGVLLSVTRALINQLSINMNKWPWYKSIKHTPPPPSPIPQINNKMRIHSRWKMHVIFLSGILRLGKQAIRTKNTPFIIYIFTNRTLWYTEWTQTHHNPSEHRRFYVWHTPSNANAPEQQKKKKIRVAHIDTRIKSAKPPCSLLHTMHWTLYTCTWYNGTNTYEGLCVHIFATGGENLISNLCIFNEWTRVNKACIIIV